MDQIFKHPWVTKRKQLQSILRSSALGVKRILAFVPTPSQAGQRQLKRQQSSGSKEERVGLLLAALKFEEQWVSKDTVIVQYVGACVQ